MGKVGRPFLPEEKKAKNHTFKLYDWEVQKIKDFIKIIRSKPYKD